MRAQGYLQIAELLSKKCILRDTSVSALLAKSDTVAITSRAERMKMKLRESLYDADIKPSLVSATCTGLVRCERYHIENIVLTCGIGYSIPVNVYVPKASGKVPAIVVSIGHWLNGKAIPENQIMCANLALNGFIVATYDPLCQGERRQFNDSEVADTFWGLPEDMVSVSLHTQPGNLAYLLNKNVAALFVHDSVLVVDYLCGRKDVDCNRIGCTGQSGGGTQSLYLSAMDDRVKYVSPIQCLSKLQLMLPHGIGDCEQSLISMSKEMAFDYPDLLWASFPKQIMLNGATDDSFPFQGAKETEREIGELYAIAGISERFTAHYAECRHEISECTRENAYRWFSRVMCGRMSLPEQAVSVFNSEIRCFVNPQEVGRSPQAVYRDIAWQRIRLQPREPDSSREELKLLLSRWPQSCEVTWLDQENIVCQTQGLDTHCHLLRHGSENLTVVIADKDGKYSGEDSYLFIRPWALHVADSKARPIYDEETRIFNAATVMGQNIAACRVQHISAVVDVALSATGCQSVTIVGILAGALPALLVACMHPAVQKSHLFGLIPSFSALYNQRSYLLPETSILPGLLSVADVDQLLHCARNVTLYTSEHALRGELYHNDS